MEVDDAESSSSLRLSSSSTPYTDATNCKKQSAHVKRPMNSFMVWSQLERRKMILEDPTMHNAEISRLLGLKWKQLSIEQRLPFKEEAARLKELHELEFPGYKYQPQKKKPKNRKATDAVKRSSNKKSLPPPRIIQNQQQVILRTIKVEPPPPPPRFIRNQQELMLSKIEMEPTSPPRKKKMLPNIIRKRSSTMSDANVERKLLMGGNPSEQSGTSQTWSRNTKTSLQFNFLMYKSEAEIDEAHPNSERFDEHSFSLFEKKCAGEIPLSADDIAKLKSKKKTSTDKKRTFITDKQFRDNLQGKKSAMLRNTHSPSDDENDISEGELPSYQK